MKAQRDLHNSKSGNHIRYGISIAALAVFWSVPAFAQSETAAEVVADQACPNVAEDKPPAPVRR
jgi:hypothetical protein